VTRISLPLRNRDFSSEVRKFDVNIRLESPLAVPLQVFGVDSSRCAIILNNLAAGTAQWSLDGRNISGSVFWIQPGIGSDMFKVEDVGPLITGEIWITSLGGSGTVSVVSIRCSRR